MKKGSLCLLLALSMLFTACSAAPSSAELPGELAQISWGESAAEIIRHGTVADCALIKPAEFAGLAAIEVLNFDGEERLGMGGYAVPVSEDNIREVFQTLKAELIGLYGEPQGFVHQTAAGQKPENWEESLSITDSFQMVWPAEGGLCYLSNASPGYIMVSFLMPEGREGDSLGNMPWGLTLDSLSDLPGIEQYSLVRENVSLWEHSARLVYRFDANAGVFAAHYELSPEDPIGVYKSLLKSLKETYGKPDKLVTNESGGEIVPARGIADVEADGVLNCADMWSGLSAADDIRLSCTLQLYPDASITLAFFVSK